MFTGRALSKTYLLLLELRSQLIKEVLHNDERRCACDVRKGSVLHHQKPLIIRRDRKRAARQ